ncbi:MAG: thermonuclease family protein [Rhodospirillales bacterium]
MSARRYRCLVSIGFAVCVAATAWVPALAEDLVGRAKIIDGDTLDIGGERVRLNGIDAPEKAQQCEAGPTAWACGSNATRALASATQDGNVTCRGDKRDRYGRLLAVCYVNGVDLNAQMVRDGWALAYRRYSLAYVGEEAEARAAGRGMWRGQFIEPWEWRSAQRPQR